MWLRRKQAEALRALAAISHLTQKDPKNKLKFQASRDPVNSAPETALLLLSDDRKLCPSLFSLLIEHEATTSRSQGNSRQCLAHLVQVGDAVLRVELHFCMDRQEGLKDAARKKPANTTLHKSQLVQRHGLLCPSKELLDLIWASSTGVEQMGTWADSLGARNLPAPETPWLGE